MAARRNSFKGRSRASGTTRGSFQRRFEQVTGLPPGEWLIAERIRLAQEHLERDAVVTLEDIAAKCGFGSLETMRHHFRRRAGTTPGAYRKRFSLAARQLATSP